MSVSTSFPPERRYVTLPARPEPLRLAVEETAVIVVDMQNAYASPNGYLDLAGFDVTAQGSGTAVLDRRHDLELGQAQMSGMDRPIGRTCDAEDIGNLERGTQRLSRRVRSLLS